MKVAFYEVIFSENRRSMFLDGLSLVQDTARACAMNIEVNISEMDVDRLEQEKTSYQEVLEQQIKCFCFHLDKHVPVLFWHSQQQLSML